MAGLVDSVKNLGLNGSTNGAPKAYNVRKICCVGAGYVGMLLIFPCPFLVDLDQADTVPRQVVRLPL